MAATRPRRSGRGWRGKAARGSIRTGLAAACAAIGIQAAPARAVDVDAATLLYTEPNRVTAFETVLEGRHDFGRERIGTVELTFDALTGASANGAAPYPEIQTFTSPSGQGAYTTPAGQTPLDDTFHDTRGALNAGYSFPLSRLTTAGLGAHFSTEYDYTSLGANASLSRDFDRRNRTLSLALSYSHDTVDPVGGRPVPLSPMPPPGGEGGDDRLVALRDEDEGRGTGLGSAPKDVVDAVLGITQVIDRATIAQVNYSYGRVSGYQTDPYKLLSVVDPASGAPRQYLFEKRPDARRRQSVYAQLKRHLGRSVLDLSYRYFWDDWGIRSHTADLHWRWSLGKGTYLQPHLRWYRQAAADFYHRYLLAGAPPPADASADYRLGKFHDTTVGLEGGRTLANGHQVTVRAEYYWQVGDADFAGAPGALSRLDLFPTVDAFILQVGYKVPLP